MFSLVKRNYCNFLNEHLIWIDKMIYREKMNDRWETPQWLFDELNKEFNFDIDLCATSENAKCPLFFTKENNFLKIKNFMLNQFKCAFMNPPYSNSLPFVEKAWECSQCCKIVCLLKCDTSTKAWRIFWDDINHKFREGCQVRFFKRIKFEHPIMNNKNGPAFPSVIVIMDRRNLNDSPN